MANPSGTNSSPNRLNQTNAIPRIQLIDFLRGVALIGMAVYHFVWDLEFFGITPPGHSTQPSWNMFAAFVAGSYVFISGISLYLAHADGIRWKPWAKRLAIIGGAALIITIVTFFVTPERYIRFGILHMITAAGLFGIFFVRSIWLVSAGVAALVLAIDYYSSIGGFSLDGPQLVWLGLTPNVPISTDYRPVFPWLAAGLAGIAVAGFCRRHGLVDVLAVPRFASLPSRSLRFCGRNSLLVYLIHQPILMATIWSYLWLKNQFV